MRPLYGTCILYGI
jgi:hypothetical protein